MNLADKIILFILGVASIREIIAFTGIFPQDKWYSGFIYNSYDAYIVKRTLKEVGLEQSDIKNLVRKKRYEKVKDNVDLENLIEIISKYIIKNKGNVQYGDKVPIMTPFYISTVEASYEPEYLSWMCYLMNDLIMSKQKNGTIPRLPDFIITPKGGNTFFGRTYAERHDIMFVTSKYSLKSTYVRFLQDEDEYNLKTNYEGFWKLFDKQKKCQDGPLFGVVVDCNTTTGSQIIDTIEDFNHLISNLNLNIQPITSAFTLYRPIDNNKCNIDVRLHDNGITLYRYFDLSEDNKEKILSERGTSDHLNIYSKIDKKKIESILKEIPLKA